MSTFKYQSLVPWLSKMVGVSLLLSSLLLSFINLCQNFTMFTWHSLGLHINKSFEERSLRPAVCPDKCSVMIKMAEHCGHRCGLACGEPGAVCKGPVTRLPTPGIQPHLGSDVSITHFPSPCCWSTAGIGFSVGTIWPFWSNQGADPSQLQMRRPTLWSLWHCANLKECPGTGAHSCLPTNSR